MGRLDMVVSLHSLLQALPQPCSLLTRPWTDLIPLGIVLLDVPAALPGLALVLSLLNWFVLLDLAPPNCFL